MDSSQPTLIAAAWKHRLLVVGMVALALVVGYLFTVVRGGDTRYIAEALVVLQDPASQETGAGSRFIAEQVEIMASPIVADAAAELLEQEAPELDMSSSELLASSGISSTPDSALVFISAVANEPGRAVAMANALAKAYEDVSHVRVTQSSTSALERIDAQLESLEARFSEVSAEIQSERDANEELRQLEEQYQESLTTLAQLQTQLETAEDEDADELRIRITDLRNRIDTYRLAQSASRDSPELQALLEEQDQLIIRRTELLQRRDQITIDAELAPSAVALSQSAEDATESSRTSNVRTLAVAFFLGSFAALGAAYLLEVRRRSFGGRLEPQKILGAPLLADIPLFADGSKLPVREQPRSPAAEGFRFAAASIEKAMHSIGATSVMMVSSTVGHGKSTCIVNTAMADARQGHSVLLVDCDFGSQDSSRLAAGSQGTNPVGLVDVVEDDVAFVKAITTINLGERVSFNLMSRGTRPAIAANLLLSREAGELFEEVRENYDVVFVDGPPLLQVAYASTLASYADALVVVVSHGTPVRELEDLVNRLQLIDTQIIGYLYNRSPVRKEMTVTDGSMRDILDVEGMRSSDRDQRQWWQRAGT